ncbi:MAG: ParA family protein [Coriobacteriales bacterium]
MPIITITNLKGGTGKTTTAMALATIAVRSGMPARVLDADPQGSASLWAMTASGLGEPMPFEVFPANRVTIKSLKPSGEVVIVDCPPSGTVVDDALAAADYVIIPTTPSSMDMQQTWITAQTAAESGKPFAILLTCARAKTLSLAAVAQSIEDADISCFDARIPLREDIRNYFGHSFGNDLYGYEDVYRELLAALREAD